MSAVGRRYARALFALAKDAGALEPTADGVARLAAVAEDATVAPVLGSPLLSPLQRTELAQILSRELGLSDLLARFLGYVADQQRLRQLPDIARHFQRLLDDELRRARITIRSAVPLTDPQHADLIALFARLTGKQIVPTVVLEPELLGGVVVEVEGKVYDGSVRTQLDRLARELTGTASH